MRGGAAWRRASAGFYLTNRRLSCMVAPMPEAIKASAAVLDMSPRFAQSSAVAGSPALAAITSVCALTIPAFGNLTVVSGVQLEGWVAFTVGTSGVSAKLDIRQTGVAGAVIATTGLLTVVATNLDAFAVQGIDTAPLVAGVYVLALTIGSGAAVSTVSAAQLTATVV